MRFRRLVVTPRLITKITSVPKTAGSPSCFPCLGLSPPSTEYSSADDGESGWKWFASSGCQEQEKKGERGVKEERGDDRDNDKGGETREETLETLVTLERMMMDINPRLIIPRY